MAASLNLQNGCFFRSLLNCLPEWSIYEEDRIGFVQPGCLSRGVEAKFGSASAALLLLLELRPKEKWL